MDINLGQAKEKRRRGCRQKRIERDRRIGTGETECKRKEERQEGREK